MTSRRERRRRQAEQKRRRTLMWTVGGVAVVALLVVLGVVMANRSSQVAVTLPENLEPPPNADGSAWGPPDAPVVIQEYSDFQ